MTENKRFVETVSTGIVTDNMTNKEYNCEMRIDDDFLHLINNLADENEQLKQTISKIDFAIIRKYDNSLENLLDEIYDGEYNNWIQKQLLRAKKLKGDNND